MNDLISSTLIRDWVIVMVPSTGATATTQARHPWSTPLKSRSLAVVGGMTGGVVGGFDGGGGGEGCGDCGGGRVGMGALMGAPWYQPRQ